jgi:hypothetical protein
LGDDGGDYERRSGVGGVDEDARWLIALLEALAQRKTVAVGEFAVEHHYINGLVVHEVEQIPLVLKRRYEAQAGLSLQDALEAQPDRGVGVEHDNARGPAAAAV